MGEFRKMSRTERKAHSKVLCPVCPLHVHPLDMIAYHHADGQDYYMHDKCAALIIDGIVIPDPISAAAGEGE